MNQVAKQLGVSQPAAPTTCEQAIATIALPADATKLCQDTLVPKERSTLVAANDNAPKGLVEPVAMVIPPQPAATVSTGRVLSDTIDRLSALLPKTGSAQPKAEVLANAFGMESSHLRARFIKAFIGAEILSNGTFSFKMKADTDWTLGSGDDKKTLFLRQQVSGEITAGKVTFTEGFEVKSGLTVNINSLEKYNHPGVGEGVRVTAAGGLKRPFFPLVEPR